MKTLTRCLLAVFLVFVPELLNGQKTNEVDSLLSAYHKAQNDTSKLKAMLALGYKYTISGDYTLAEQYLKSGLMLSEKINFRKVTAKFYSHIAYLFFRQSKFDEAMKNRMTALEIYKSIGDKKGIGDEYNDIGLIYKNQGDYELALKNCMLSLKLKQEIGEKNGIAVAYNAIGLIYSKQNNYPDALASLLNANKIWEETGNMKSFAANCNNIGIIYKEQGRYEDALKIYNDVLKIIETSGDPYNISRAYTNIGVVYEHLGRNDEALKNYFYVLEIRKRLNDKVGLAGTLNNIGIVYKNQGELLLLRGDRTNANLKFEEALKNHFASLKIKEETGNKGEIILSFHNIGFVYLKQNKFNEARSFFKKGIQLSKEIGRQPNNLKAGYFSLSLLDSAQASFYLTPDTERVVYWKSAYENYKYYKQFEDSVFNEANQLQIEEMKARFETEKKDKEIELLNKENDLKAMLVGKQQVSLIATKMETERNLKELQLLNKSNEVQQLKLNKVQEDLTHQRMEAQVKSREMALFVKDNKLREQELEKQKLIRNVVIGGAAMLLLFGFLLFNRYQLSKRLEQQQALEMERARISNDMHDDLGSGLSKIALLSEMLKQNSVNGQIKPVIEKISASAQEALEKMSEIVWSLNPRNDTLESLVAYIRKYAVEYMEIASIPCQVHLPENIPDELVTGEQRRNIFLAVKESLHNVVKHSEASFVDIRFINGGSHFEICIQDDGKGIDMNKKNSLGNGLRTMRERMKSIGGTCFIENNEGTEVKLAFAIA